MKTGVGAIIQPLTQSTCYHPLLLFNGEGDCLGAKPRPGNVHSAEEYANGILHSPLLQRLANLRLGKAASARNTTFPPLSYVRSMSPAFGVTVVARSRS